MKINRLLILTAVPLTIGACSFLAPPPNGTGGLQPPPRIDFNTAAKKLGVTEVQLKAALKVPEKLPIEPSSTPPPPPDIKGAATKLGISERKLIEVLGIPPHPPNAQPSTTK
ncbi:MULTISPECIES: hypothetical protein [Nostocales]|uniref:Proline/alanine-rich repeat-containing protein n=3 Tax=Nostocales TaxID=1161 RepID=A0A0C1QTR5_9CYAN|nr:hypothetical protein [Tolypothrix bouteillei]KAF3889327.1 hypothetical protein DA73_0400030485 [Tolypothrix bouteillei VB521301]